MKLYLFYVLLAYSGCDVFGEEIQKLGPKNPDDTEKIERPCGTVYDVNCVRKFFSEHGQCKKTYGPVPDPLTRSENNVYIPFGNFTLTAIIQLTRKINNGRIEEFYINRDTNNLVIAVEFRNLELESDNVYFRFYRRAKEPVVTIANATAVYSSIVITAVIPKINDLQLNEAEFVAFINDPSPLISIGPTVALSADPVVQMSIAQVFSDVTLFFQEQFLTDATYYLATYIQYNICDFGLKIV